MIIALSGPAGSGKGTLARMLAKYLGLPHYDIGLLFRAIAYANFKIHHLKVKDGRIFFCDIDITDILKTEECGLCAAKSAFLLKDLVLLFVSDASFICDGRTCGSEIFPNANYKFYITANQKDRFDRRLKDGGNLEIMSQREILDQSRLVIPADAIIIDTTGKNQDESLQEMILHLR